MEPRIAYLLQKCSVDRLTTAEQEELSAFFLNEDNRELFNEEAAQLIENTPAGAVISEEDWNPLLAHVLLVDKVSPSLKVRYRRWWQYAAAVAVLIGITGIWWHQWSNPRQPSTPIVAHIAPGTNKAVLQLSDGSTIALTDVQNGVVGQQGAAQLVKLDSGFLAYQQEKGGTTKEQVYNTLITPRGGQFKIMLPDGSMVWLNAASSLNYPASFTGDKREVSLTGEAYFEVASKAGQPFIVKSKGQTVEVLGTQFNIKAYDDEPVAATTLLTGKVKVTGTDFSRVLQPGEQASRQESRGWQLIKGIDTDQVIAWKNGFFSFNQSDITTVMRELSRWYDVEVVFDTQNRQQAFVGEIPRNVSLDKALQILSLSDIHYTIKGRTIHIID